jgi:hypothetical protein
MFPLLRLASGVEMFDVDSVDVVLVRSVVPGHGDDRSGVEKEKHCGREPANDFDFMRHERAHRDQDEKDGRPQRNNEDRRRGAIPCEHAVNTAAERVGLGCKRGVGHRVPSSKSRPRDLFPVTRKIGHVSYQENFFSQKNISSLILLDNRDEAGVADYMARTDDFFALPVKCAYFQKVAWEIGSVSATDWGLKTSEMTSNIAISGGVDNDAEFAEKPRREEPLRRARLRRYEREIDLNPADNSSVKMVAVDAPPASSPVQNYDWSYDTVRLLRVVLDLCIMI